MSHNFSDFTNIPPEMRGFKPPQPEMLQVDLEAFKQAVDDQIQELNKLLQQISKDIQEQLQANPSQRQSILDTGKETLQNAISQSLSEIKSNLEGKFLRGGVPAAHIDQFMQDLQSQLADEYDVAKVASTVLPDGQKVISPFEMFTSAQQKKGEIKQGAAQPPPPPPGPSVDGMNSAIQQYLASMFGGSGMPTGGGGASFDTQLVLSLIQEFLGTGNIESKQVLFQQIQMAMNQGQGANQGIGAPSLPGAGGASGADNIPSIFGGASFQFGTPPASLPQALQYALKWQSLENSNQNSPAYKLATALVNEVNSLITSGKSFSDLQNWVSSTFSANSDIYFQYPGLTTHEAQNLYFITQGGVPPGTEPQPTSVDIAIFTANYLLSQATANSDDSKLLSGLINAIKTQLPNGSQGNLSNLKNSAWFQNTFNQTQDVYMQYPNASRTTLQEMFKLMGLPQLPPPTQIDVYYSIATTILKGLYPNDAAVINSLLQIFQRLGSQGTVTQLQQAGQAYINSNGPIFTYARAVIQNAFRGLTNLAVDSSSAPFYKMLYSAIATYQQAPPGSGTSSLFSYLLNLSASTIGSNTNDPTKPLLTIVQQALQSQFNNSVDFYARYPSVTGADIQNLINITGATFGYNPLVPTAADNIIIQVYNLLRTLPRDSKDYQIISSLLAQLQAWGSTPLPSQNVAAWLNGNFPAKYDIFMADPDIAPNVVNLLSTLSGQTLKPTATDAIYKQAYDWSQTVPSASPDGALASALAAYVLSLGSNGTYSNTWAANIFKSNFSAYPGISVDAILKFCQYAGVAVNPLDPYRIEIQQWLQQNNGAAQQAFGNAILNAISSFGATGTVAQLTAWFQQLLDDGPGKLDAYCQFPGLTANDVASIAGQIPNVTPRLPTQIDAIWLQYNSFLQTDSNPQDKALITRFLNGLQALGNMAGASQAQVTQALQTWFNSNFSIADPYMQYPTATNTLIATLYGTVGKANTGPTAVDKIYLSVYAYLNSLSPNAKGDVQLITDLLKQMYNPASQPPTGIGSYGNFLTVSYWALGVVKSNFSGYPSVSQATKLKFQQFAKIDLNSIQAEIQALLNNYNPNAAAYKFITALLNQVKALQPNGTIADVENWYASTFNHLDPYFQYQGQPPLSQGDLQNVFNIILLGNAPPPTVMDVRFAQVYQYAMTVSGQNKNLIQDLIKEINSLGSNGTPGQLQSWCTDFIRNSAVYGAADPSVKQAFLKFCRQW